VCIECGTGEYSSEGSSTCNLLKNCDINEYVEEEGTTTVDKKCTNCPQGYFSNQLNSSHCHTGSISIIGNLIDEVVYQLVTLLVIILK
jgi:hypothetical protein